VAEEVVRDGEAGVGGAEDEDSFWGVGWGGRHFFSCKACALQRER
jgi:hypothetical protein